MHRLGPIVPALHASNEKCLKASGWVEVSLLVGETMCIATYGGMEPSLSCSPSVEEDTFYTTKSSCLSKGIEAGSALCKLLTFQCGG